MRKLSPEQCETIYEEMLDGFLLPEIESYTLGECIWAIRALPDDKRGDLLDTWLLALSSKYSHAATKDPRATTSFKLVIESARQIAKAYGADAANKKKDGGRSIIIRKVATTRASGVGGDYSELGPHASGAHVDTGLQEQINSEVLRQLARSETVNQERDDGQDEDADGQDREEVPGRQVPPGDQEEEEEVILLALPVAAQRLLSSKPLPVFDLLADLPGDVAPIPYQLLTSAAQLAPFDEDDGADFTATIHDDPREHWASSRGRAVKVTTFGHPDATHIPMTPTGARADNKQLFKQMVAVQGLGFAKQVKLTPIQKAREVNASKAAERKLLVEEEETRRKAYRLDQMALDFPETTNKLLDALEELM